MARQLGSEQISNWELINLVGSIPKGYIEVPQLADFLTCQTSAGRDPLPEFNAFFNSLITEQSRAIRWHELVWSVWANAQGDKEVLTSEWTKLRAKCIGKDKMRKAMIKVHDTLPEIYLSHRLKQCTIILVVDGLVLLQKWNSLGRCTLPKRR